MSRLCLSAIFVVLAFALHGCGANPFAIMPAAMLETNREAENNYIKAKELEDQGKPEEAYWLYRRAANGRHPIASYVMGTYLAEGYYTRQDYVGARRYFDIAAFEADLMDAYIYLAEIDFYGKGKPRAVVQGYKWMLIGTREDPLLRREMRDEMDAEMTEKQLVTAEKYAMAWLEARERSTVGVSLE